MILFGNANNYDDHRDALKGGLGRWEELINAQTLKKLDFESIQSFVKMIQEKRLVAANDLISRGLTFGEDIGTTVVTTHNLNDMEDAKISINPTQLGDDQTSYNLTSVPLPIIHKTFSIPWRQEGFDYKRGNGTERSIRKIMEASNNLVVNGDDSVAITINGALQKLYGYTTHPNRAQVTITDWTAATTSILSDMKLIMSAQYDANNVDIGPQSLMFYVAPDVWITLRDQAFANKGEKSFYAQILATYPEIIDIKPDPDMATQNVTLVAMTSEHVQMAVAQNPIIVPHVKEVSIAPSKFTAYAVWTPIIHVDSNSKTGIVHGSV